MQIPTTSYEWASWFWRKYCGLALPSRLKIKVCLLLRRAGTLVLLTQWEEEGLSPCWWLVVGLCDSHIGCPGQNGSWESYSAYFVVLALSWTVLTTSAVMQPSDQVIPCLHCIAILSTLAWDDTTHFPSPLASFVFPLCFYLLFLSWFSFSKEGKTRIVLWCFSASVELTNEIFNKPVLPIPTHLSVSL